ncbi:hypothetical protein [Pseudomonas helvetica]|uniref:hypothetical protein n=1 Tax=Pseudomonas helvetica TaxID=3136738 RepID=UPI0032668720
MTAIQICALIGIILGAALIYWIGYRGGLIDGRFEGAEEGKNIEHAASAKTIRELEASLQFLRADHTHLAQLCKKLRTGQTFGADERQTLLCIAEKLKLAADTFRAMSSKSQAIQALELRDKALSMAALLEPVAQERAA